MERRRRETARSISYGRVDEFCGFGVYFSGRISVFREKIEQRRRQNAASVNPFVNPARRNDV